MLAKQNETTTKRVPLTPTTYERLRTFSRGLDASYDETINLLLDLVIQPGEDPLLAGKRKRESQRPKRDV